LAVSWYVQETESLMGPSKANSTVCVKLYNKRTKNAIKSI
jgi:hypothetical protein